MGALVLGIVLIIGYHYQTYHPTQRLKFSRRTGYHIYFKAGFSGLLLLASATFLWSVIDFFDFPSKLVTHTNIQSTVVLISDYGQWNNLKALAISIIMFIISCIINCLFRIYYFFFPLIFFKKLLNIVNDLERLIILATVEAEFIRVELDCGKVYVGIPKSPDIENGVITHLTIFPFLSGHRADDDNKSIIFANNYEKHYQSLLGDSDSENNTRIEELMEEFMVVIPAESIIIASNFNLEAYTSIHNDKVDLSQ